jgi:aspartokinase-like uncharacterized kinase
MSEQPPPSISRVRVVKVGGSLFDLQPLRAALSRWLDQQPAAVTVLIAGGGPLADAIRRADQVHGLGEESAHALCIQAMGVTARLLAEMLADRATLATWDELAASIYAARPNCAVLDVPTFIAAADTAGQQPALPHTWEVTSDSIAAAVALALKAHELVLLKSCDPPMGVASEEHHSIASLAAAGYVDGYFPFAVAGYSDRLRFVNLRGLR